MAYNSPLLFDSTTEDEAINRYGTSTLPEPGLESLAAFADGFKTQQAQTMIAAENILPDAITGEDADYPEFHHAEGDWATLAQNVGKMAFDGAAYATSVWGGLAASPFTLGTSVVAAPAAMKGLLSYRDFGVAKQEAKRRGVDEHTANEIGAVQAAQTFLLFDLKLPLGNQISKLSSPAIRIGARVGTGAATQIGLDAAGTETRASILEANGYGKGDNKEWIKQLRQWDWKRIAADGLMGQMLGAHENFGEIIGRNVKGDGTPITSDDFTGAKATISADEALHNSAPGIPVDAQSAAAHTAAGFKAMDDIANGRPVDVSGTGIHDATFLREAGPADVREADFLVKQRKAILAADQKNLDAVENNLAAAERDGMTDLASHYRTELTRWQANVERSRSLLDEAQGTADFMRDPMRTDYGQAVKRGVDNAEDWQAEIDAENDAFDFDQTPPEQPHTGHAAMDEAQQLYTDYSNSAAQEGAPRWAEDMTALRQPTETRKKLADTVQTLLQQHAGDEQMTEYLKTIVKDHAAETDEFRTYELLAQCAIENM